MINRTKKHLWPVPLVAALAVVGVMAAFIALSASPSTAQAQSSICDDASGATLQVLIDAGYAKLATLSSRCLRCRPTYRLTIKP